MPCNCDHMNANSLEIELSRTWCLGMVRNIIMPSASATAKAGND